MAALLTNNAVALLSAGINNSVTTFSVVSNGSLFPAPTGGNYAYVTLADSTGNIEIVKYTARSGNTFFGVARGQDGSTALSFLANDTVELRAVAGNFSLPAIATANTDYLAPALANTAVGGFKTATFDSQIASTVSTTSTVTTAFANGQMQKLTASGTSTVTLAFTFPGVGHYQLWYLPGASVTTVWPTIGSTWQWASSTTEPLLNVGTYGGMVNLSYDGSIVIASYFPVGTP